MIQNKLTFTFVKISNIFVRKIEIIFLSFYIYFILFAVKVKSCMSAFKVKKDFKTYKTSIDPKRMHYTHGARKICQLNSLLCRIVISPNTILSISTLCAVEAKITWNCH